MSVSQIDIQRAQHAEAQSLEYAITEANKLISALIREPSNTDNHQYVFDLLVDALLVRQQEGQLHRAVSALKTKANPEAISGDQE